MLKKFADNVCIVILNWNNAADTCECLDSVLRITYSNYKIVLVDNGSEDSSFKTIQFRYEKEEKIKFIRNKTNLGFTGGNNVGIKYALKCNSEYIFILNNDTVVDKNILSELIKPYEKFDNLAITTPKMYFYNRKNTLWSAGGEFNPKELVIRMCGFNEYDTEKYDIGRECSFATGAAMFIKASILREIGLFDETLFHSGEDLDLSIRVTQVGYTMRYVPSAVLWHKVMASTGKGGNITPLGAYYEYRNKLIILKRYGYLKSLRAKVLIFTKYMKTLLSFLIKKRNFKITGAICVGVVDFMFGRNGELSDSYMEKKWARK